MLSIEENKELTGVASGTPCGDYMRRFWHPIAASDEVKEVPMRVRVLGEDLVLFRDPEKRLGLLGIRCPHRGTSLELGTLEPEGLRCKYHGWLFNSEGRCLDQPAEPPDSTFKDRIKHLAYPVQELGDLVFAYMGKGAPPPLPHFDVLVRKDGVRYSFRAYQWPCNYLQITENGTLDPWHTLFAHGGTVGRYSSGGLKVWSRESDIGISLIQVRKGEEDNIYIREVATIMPHIGKLSLRPLRKLEENEEAMPPTETMVWHTPVDDTNTVAFRVDFVPSQDGDRDKLLKYIKDVAVPERWANSWPPQRDEEGKHLMTHVPDQDAAIVVYQGSISTRQEEHLGTTDRTVIMFRRLLKKGIEDVKKGVDPKGVIKHNDVVQVQTTDGLLTVEKKGDLDQAIDSLGEEWVKSGRYES